MTDTEKVLLYSRVLETWGYPAQENMLMEETGELLSAIGKFDRGRVEAKEVITELADVSIMVEQMAVHFGLEEFMQEKEFKLRRLNGRVKRWKITQSFLNAILYDSGIISRLEPLNWKRHYGPWFKKLYDLLGDLTDELGHDFFTEEFIEMFSTGNEEDQQAAINERHSLQELHDLLSEYFEWLGNEK